jgi:hypothetical protein
VGSLLLVCLIAFTHGLEGFARSTLSSTGYSLSP